METKGSRVVPTNNGGATMNELATTILDTATVNLEKSAFAMDELMFVVRTREGGIIWHSESFKIPIGGRVQLPGKATDWIRVERNT